MASITDPYATPAQYMAATGKISSAEDSILRRDLVAVSRYIDEHTGRFFGRYTTPEARLFIGDGSNELYVDDIGSTSGLVIKIDEDNDGSVADDSALSTTDYQLWPLNAASSAQPKPWRTILLPAWSSRGNWPKGLLVSVTAAWGWPAVPEQIVVATIELTRLVRIEGPRATNRMDEGGIPLLLSRDAQARNIIADLMFSFGFKVVVA